MAVDSAVMVLDSAKGIEAQTEKLFQVCRARNLPVLTFLNKYDRPGREPLELLDEIGILREAPAAEDDALVRADADRRFVDLLGLDADPIELPKTEALLRTEGFGEDCFTAKKSNFAGLQAALAGQGADVILADLGVSSMQLDNPERGFTSKHAGPLDMRMNPSRGIPASKWLERVRPEAFAEILRDNSDEPHAELLAPGELSRSLKVEERIKVKRIWDRRSETNV